MRLCYIGKYPPIQGGVSRQGFWMARALAERGFEVHVVTNAPEVEIDYRIFDLDGRLPDGDAPPYQGDGVTVHGTTGLGKPAYIPWAKPYLTSLAALAATVVREHSCELILGSYFEPYGMAAHLAARWTSVPYGLRHSGSDIGRLFQMPALRPAYVEMIRAADFLLPSSSVARNFAAVGVNVEKIHPANLPGLPPRWFHPAARPLDLDAVIAACGCGAALEPGVPIIGLYGKAGEFKGTYDLIASLGRLHGAGTKFHLVAAISARPVEMEKVRGAIEQAGIGERTRLLPFIPHWRIAGFIRACTAVCFLERGFPIAIHTPTVPEEVLACGGCLILSREIAAAESWSERYRDGHNVILVEPRDAESMDAGLRTVLDNPTAASEMGRRGHEEVHRGRDAYTDRADRLAALLREIKADTGERRSRMSIAEMQAALARLTMDTSFRRLFELEPEPTLEGYRLDEAERAALLSIDRKMLAFFARSVKGKRRAKVEALYRRTKACLDGAAADGAATESDHGTDAASDNGTAAENNNGTTAKSDNGTAAVGGAERNSQAALDKAAKFVISRVDPNFAEGVGVHEARASRGRGDFDRLFDRFYALHPAEPHTDTLPYAVQFGRFLEDTLVGDPDAPPHAADLARYERLLVESSLEVDDADAMERVNDRPRPAAPIDPTARPRRRAGVRSGAFDCDVLAVASGTVKNPAEADFPAAAKNAAETPPKNGHAAGKSRHYLAFRPAGTGPARVFRINEPLYVLLQECDGESSIDDLVAQCEKTFGVRGLHEQVRATLDDLLTRGLVRI